MERNFLALKQRMKTDDMTRHGTIMVVFTLLASFFVYIYQLAMGALLTPVEYGTLLSLLSLFTIVSIFSQTIQTSVAKFTSRFKVQNRLGGIKYLWKFSLKRTLLLGSVLFLILALLSPLISRFLNIDNNWYFILLFSALILYFTFPANLGVLQGLQRFLPLGLSHAIANFLRLAIGVLLVYFGFGLYGALLCIPLAVSIGFIVSLSFIRDVARVKNERVEVRGLFAYTGLALLAIFAFGMLTNIDVVLAKHYLGPENAGNYAAISILGRIVLLAPMGVAVAMFPKTSDLFEAGGAHRPLLLKAMSPTVLLAGAVVLVFWLFPDFVIDLLFGGKYPSATPYLFEYGLAMALFAIAFLLLSYFLSLNQTKVAFPFLGAMVLQLVLIAFFHSSIAQLVDIMFISGVACLASMLPFYLKLRRVNYEH